MLDFNGDSWMEKTWMKESTVYLSNVCLPGFWFSNLTSPQGRGCQWFGRVDCLLFTSSSSSAISSTHQATDAARVFRHVPDGYYGKLARGCRARGCVAGSRNTSLLPTTMLLGRPINALWTVVAISLRQEECRALARGVQLLSGRRSMGPCLSGMRLLGAVVGATWLPAASW